jgi:hypothetical protein
VLVDEKNDLNVYFNADQNAKSKSEVASGCCTGTKKSNCCSAADLSKQGVPINLADFDINEWASEYLYVFGLSLILTSIRFIQNLRGETLNQKMSHYL